MSQFKQQVISADFFTKTHRYSASIMVGNRRLADVMNDRSLSSLDMKDVYISRVNKPSEIIGPYKIAALIKEAICFIIVAHENDATSQHRRYNSFIGQVRQKAFLVSTPFELQGKVELYGKVDLKSLLAESNNTFMPLFSGQAINPVYPEVNFAGPAILVNKTHIDFLSILDND